MISPSSAVFDGGGGGNFWLVVFSWGDNQSSELVTWIKGGDTMQSGFYYGSYKLYTYL